MVTLARVLAMLAVATSSLHARPALTGVSLRVEAAGGPVTASDVVWRGGQAWFAISVGSQVRVYRWQRGSWALDGIAMLPANTPGPQPGTGLGSTSVTGGYAPDFTIKSWGADTLWFALVARRGDRWRIVPFDDQFGMRHSYTFAYGPSHHLITGIFDPCGCAGGPTTYQWYRYARGLFVPTSPPGRPPPCSASALASASHWFDIPDDPLVRHVAQPFPVRRFACGDGWALATDGRRVSLYQQSGPHWVQAYQPGGGRWLRVGVGSPRLVGTETDFALSRSVLNRLGRRIGVRFPSAPHSPSKPTSPGLTRWERAPIALTFRPGDSYVQDYVPGGLSSATLLKVEIDSRRGTRVMRFQWRSTGWVKQRRR